METGTFLTGFRLPEPLFVFGRGKSSSTSAFSSEGPADRNSELGYKQRVSEIVPWVFSDGTLDGSKGIVYQDLFRGSERFIGMSNSLRVRIPDLDKVAKTNLLDYQDPKGLDQLVSSSRARSIVLALLRDERWRSTLKAVCDYRGLSSQVISKVLRKPVPRPTDQMGMRQYQNILKNLVVEIYAKCGGIPWVLAKPIGRKQFVGLAWIALNEYFVFSFVPFDSRGAPMYEGAILRIFQRSVRDFRSCSKSIVEEGLGQMNLTNSRLVLHFHGNLFGLEDSFTRILSDRSSDWVVLSVESPQYPFFRLFSQTTRDGLNEKGICVPLDKKRFVISTTGIPHFNVKGTPQNLFCESMKELEQSELLEEAVDIYHLAQLNWAHTRGFDKLPVTTLLTSNIATGFRDGHIERQRLGLWTSQTPEAKPWSYW
jgi:hypothetical protein